MQLSHRLFATNRSEMGIKMKQQTVYSDYAQVLSWLEGKKIFLVCGDVFENLRIKKCFENADYVRFTDYIPNPQYASIKKGVECFKNNKCDAIMAVGGGSAIDIAKCVRLFCSFNCDGKIVDRENANRSVPFMVMPTTAGTGSESTRFAVVYKNGEKISITHESCIPDIVFFDASVLSSLPEYQKKAAMLDALCHSVESFWSINSTEESRRISIKALKIILGNWENYLIGDHSSQENMLRAANLAGKAIDIAETTAGHAMSYKLTTLYGIADGHAAAMCVGKLWIYMIKNVDRICDQRGVLYLKKIFDELAAAMGCYSPLEAADMFGSILNDLNMEMPDVKKEDLEVLVHSVNKERLKNNPVTIDENNIRKLYQEILRR